MSEPSAAEPKKPAGLLAHRVSMVPVGVGALACAALIGFSSLASGVRRPSALLNGCLIACGAVLVLSGAALVTSRFRREARVLPTGFGAALVALIALVAASVLVIIPNLIEARVNNWGNPSANLRKLIRAQSSFREGDKERDGNLDYGALSELAEARLIDEVLGSGTKGAFLYECTYSATTSEFLWFATATPLHAAPPRWYAEPTWGDHYYAVNHEGVVFYSTRGPIPMNTTNCSIPPGPSPY